MHAGPYHLLTTWNGTSAEAYSLVLVSFGHRCLTCSKLFISEASDMVSKSIACAACCAVTVATRHWVVNADNCVVANAVASLQAIRQQQDSTVRTLDMSYLSPVKSAVVSPSRFLTPQSKLLSLFVCSKCDAFLPSSAATRFCMKCHQAFGEPVVYSLADGIELSPQLKETYRLVPPSCKQLLLAGYRLPAEVRVEQELSQLLPEFPDYPLTDPAEISRASSKGIYVSHHTCGEKAAKSGIDLIAACEARIGKTDGYPFISYLGSAKRPGLTDRLKAQRSLLHLLRDCSYQSIMVAASMGRLLVFDEKKETLSNLSTVDQCGDHTYNATAVTFHFGPRFRASVSGLGFRPPPGRPPQVPHGAFYQSCTIAHNCANCSNSNYAASSLNYYLLRMQHEAEVPSAETWWSTTWSEARNRGPK